MIHLRPDSCRWPHLPECCTMGPMQSAAASCSSRFQQLSSCSCSPYFTISYSFLLCKILFAGGNIKEAEGFHSCSGIIYHLVAGLGRIGCVLTLHQSSWEICKYQCVIKRMSNYAEPCSEKVVLLLCTQHRSLPTATHATIICG